MTNDHKSLQIAPTEKKGCRCFWLCYSQHMDTEENIIEVNSASVSCAGAPPPLDHPVVYIALNVQHPVHCPYCNQAYLQTPKK